ncbi:lytic transglycosylase domain-containing protein [Sporolactobacillus kofuensis]|uniref:Lytic transglycosylase domain-containing protein n=1 Tax=Sporolactobacillus kofuensis TaxID=269672 RepID=A0ABW1WEF3_9BACL|nr:lytic transglycosylase domain-containing protein [Sporolactobacillus kofuensis]
MSVDPNTIAQLLSMSMLSGNQSTLDQSSLSSGQTTNNNFSNLLNTLILLMENGDDSSSTTTEQSSGGLDSLAYMPNMLESSASTNRSDGDNQLWQQLSSSVSPLSQHYSSLGTSSSVNQTTSDYNDTIQAMSKKYGVDARLIQSVIDAESGGNALATSNAGAQGLMQLMPGTANALGVDNPYDPVQNIEGGTKYLRKLLDRYDGNYSLALAAYNSGSGNVEKYGGVPPFAETQAYVKKIMNNI